MKVQASNTRARRRALVCASATALTLALAPHVAWAIVPTTTPIDTNQPYYLQSQVGTTVAPDFQGGTLRDDQDGATDSNAYLVEDFPTNTIDAYGNLTTYTGGFSGVGPLTVTDSVGGGVVAITGASSLTGPLTINSATLRLGDGTTNGSVGGDINDNGVLNFNISDSQAVSNKILGSGSIEILSGRLISQADSAVQGVVLIDGGATLEFGNDASANHYLVGSTIADNGALVINWLPGTGYAYNDGIIGSGSLTVHSGLIESEAPNSYTGLTTIDADGELLLSGSSSIASSSGLVDDGEFDISYTKGGATIQTLSGSGQVSLGSKTLTLAAASGTFGGVIAGSGALHLQGGTETLTGISTFTGLTTIDKGTTLQLGDGVSNGDVGASVEDDGALIFKVTGSQTIANSISGPGTIELASGSLFANGDSEVGQATIDKGAHLIWGNDGSNDHYLVGDSLVDNGTLDVNWLPSTGYDVAVPISGSGAISVHGGILGLEDVNTYTGLTTVDDWAQLLLVGGGSIADSAGVVANGLFDIHLSDAGASIKSLAGSSTGSVALGSKTLTLTAATGDFAGVISGSGALHLTGGAQTLSGASTFSGGLTIDAGATAKLSGDGALADSRVVDSGTLDISGATSGDTIIATLSGAGGVTLGSQTLRLAQAADTFSGVLSGSGGGLEVIAGTETLTGANTYSGLTVVDAKATLKLTGSGSIAPSYVVSEGTFDISGTTSGASVQGVSGGAGGSVVLGTRSLTVTSGADDFQGVISGSGGLTIAGGYEILEGINTYTGLTTISNGALFLNGSGAIAASSGVVDNGQLDISQTNKGASITTLSGTGFLNTGSRTLTLTDASGSFSGDIEGGPDGGVTIASGTESLAGQSFLSGHLTIDAGATLAMVGPAEAVNAHVADNGVFDISAADGYSRIGGLGGDGKVTLGSQTLYLEHAADSFGGGISGSGGLGVDGGSQTLTAVNSYTGATKIGAGGALHLGGAGSIAQSSGVEANGLLDISATTSGASIKTLSGGGEVSLGARTLTLTAADDTFGGFIDGAGGLHLGAGTETLTGNSTYTGKTVVDSGATLALASDGSISDSSLVTVDGVLDISAFNPSAKAIRVNVDDQIYGTFNGVLPLSNGPASDTLSWSSAGFHIDASIGLTDASGALQAVIFTSGDDVYELEGPALGGPYVGKPCASSPAEACVVLTQVPTDLGPVIAMFNGEGICCGESSLLVSETGGTALRPEIRSLDGSGRVQLGANTLVITAGRSVFAGGISGSGGLEIDGGAQGLSGVNGYAGLTTIKPGATLALLGKGSIAHSAGVKDNGLFDISGTTAGASIVSLSGHGRVRLGAETLTLTDAAGTFSGDIFGAGSLIVGGGTETLSGVNGLTGDTIIGAGAGLRLTGAGSIASSAVVDDGLFDVSATASGGAIRSLSGGGSVILSSTGYDLLVTDAYGLFTGVISGNGGLDFEGGHESLSGANTYTGPTAIGEGVTLALVGDGSISSSVVVSVNGGRLDITGASGDESLRRLAGGGAVTLGSNSLVLTEAQDEFAGVISGAGGLTIAGGKEVLSGDNSFSGPATIDPGATLQLGAGGATGSVASDILDNGALVFDYGVDALYGKAISGSGSVSVTSPGHALVLTGNSTFAGGTTIASSSALYLGHGGTTGSIVGDVADDGMLVFDRSDAVTFGGTISGSGGVLVTGGGTVSLAADETYTGPTGVDVGSRLNLGAGGAAGSVATPLITDLGTVGFNRSNAVTWAGVIQGSGRVVIGGSGPVTFTGANTYTGGTAIDPGATLKLGAGGTTGWVAGDITDNGLLVFDRSDTVVFDRVISGSGGLTQAGAGTLVLDNVNTLTGRTTVAAGTLEVGDAANPGAVLDSHVGGVLVNAGGALKGHGAILGAVTNNGLMSPGGSIGTLTVASFTQGPGGTLAIELTPTASSQLHVIGAANLGGALALSFDPGTYGPHVYSIITAGSVNGTFASVTMSGQQAGLVYGVGYSSSGVQLVEAPTADANVYGQVTQATLDRAQTFASLVEDSFGQAVCASGSNAPQDDCNGMRAWAKVIGSSDHVNASGGSAAFTNKGAGAVGGIEKGWGQGMTLGVAFGYTENNLRINAANTSASGRSYYLAAYGRLAQGPLQLDGQGFWMKSDWPLKRGVTGFGTASSNPDGDSEGFLVQASAPIGLSALKPYLRFTYAHFSRGATSETGVGLLGFEVDGAGADAAVGEAGLIFDPAAVSLGSARVFPTLRVGIQQDFASRTLPVAASLASFAGSGFTTAYERPGRTTGVADFALKARLTQSFDLTGDIRSRFGSGQSEVTGGFGGVIHF